ncbi:MAG: hypothetical protein K6E92_05655 [Lachnospiraceae bacterium]|nr:hypothetical protein [Lachnospiraceae bacterium]
MDRQKNTTAKILRVALLFVLFNAALFALLCRAQWVLRDKSYSGAQDRFRQWKPASADVVFIGNSHNFCTIDPDLLYEEYGIESFMLSTSAQTIPMSYYAAMEAIELRRPKTIVLELSYVANDFMTVGQGMDNSFFDGMPLCSAKKAAIEDLYEKEDRIWYYLPMGLYHGRWKNLTEADYRDFQLTKRGTFHAGEVYQNRPIPLVDEGERMPMPERMEEYLIRLMDLCEEEGVRLLLYVAPFNSLYDSEDAVADLQNRQRMFNHACALASERGVRVRNLFYELEDLGIDDSTDWRDEAHFNDNGQAKVTRYLADTGFFS